jgi:hypothetical protein
MAQCLAAHYGMLLGLDESWEVADGNLELEAKRVTIRLDFIGKRGDLPRLRRGLHQGGSRTETQLASSQHHAV